jgi:hypothetical protein
LVLNGKIILTWGKKNMKATENDTTENSTHTVYEDKLCYQYKLAC